MPIINNGEPVPVVEISTGLSLGVIVGVLVVTVAASLLSPAGKAQTAVSNARRNAIRYLDLGYEEDPRLREAAYTALCKEERVIRSLPAKYRARIREGQTELVELIDRAHAIHEDRVARRAAGLPYRM